jgi:hypothetical protein
VSRAEWKEAAGVVALAVLAGSKSCRAWTGFSCGHGDVLNNSKIIITTAKEIKDFA